MANIMNMLRLKNNVSRNGFDLSGKRNFTAKVGELLPVINFESIPGDKWQVNLRELHRTQPLNTAAFARIQYYYDFFFVPYRVLWNRANEVFSQMNYNQQHAISSTLSSADFGKALSGEFPYLSENQLATYVKNMYSLPLLTSVKNNFFGFNRAELTCKLLEYLNMGDYSGNLTDGSTMSYSYYNTDLNIGPLLSYQKIYADFYRDQQWEKPDPGTFNVDYMTGISGTSMNFSIPAATGTAAPSFYSRYNLFDLRYCNWQKDYYHGLLPNPQYGDTAVVPLPSFSGGKLLYTQDDALVSTGSTTKYPITSGSWSASSASSYAKAEGFSILALRQYEFLQKWKEIVQSNDQDYASQMKAIWNVDVSNALSNTCTYLGTVKGSIDINEVVNTNLSTDSSQASIFGKGISQSGGNIEFTNPGELGYFMCIYHALPMPDYTFAYINPTHQHVNAEDFANPVFDKVGMQPVNVSTIQQYKTANPDSQPTPRNVGYAPRYVEYKTNIDLSLGAFRKSLSNWVMSYTADDFDLAWPASGEEPSPEQSDSLWSWPAFKVSPNSVDPLFASEATSSVDTDQLLISSYFDVKVVRNLDTNGLPY